ncbi:hypothetical protein [Deinococcus pimensis]|uniref:hypothetical protein n=1 Tax=Deinococcus pimensis TaxID=309888 RepID=UPI000485AA0A|nr:hypothetical protein [Deinococcus pimensis]
MHPGLVLNVVCLVVGGVLLGLSGWRYRAARPEYRPLYKWTGLGVLGLSVFVGANLAWGEAGDALSPATFAALGAILAPAWGAAAVSHYLATRRESDHREPPFVLVACTALIVMYSAARAVGL